MGRAPCCEKVGLKKGRWTAEEDEILVKYIQTHGEGSWRSLPKNAGLKRCGKSCRLRWINYLRADVKRGNISPEEEEIIIKLHASFGNRWSLIAGHLPGRTDNEIKNYWNSHLSRRIHTFRKFGDGDQVVVDLGKLAAGCKRRGGRTSRSAMKKNSLINLPSSSNNRDYHKHQQHHHKPPNNNQTLPQTLLVKKDMNEHHQQVEHQKPSSRSTTTSTTTTVTTAANNTTEVSMNLAGLDVILGPLSTDTSNTESDSTNNNELDDICFWGDKKMEELLFGSTDQKDQIIQTTDDNNNNSAASVETTTTTTTTNNTTLVERDQEVGSQMMLMDFREMVNYEGCKNMWDDEELGWQWLLESECTNSSAVELSFHGVDDQGFGFHDDSSDTWLL